MVPDAATNSKTQSDYLLPKVEDWSITTDDMNAYYEVFESFFFFFFIKFDLEVFSVHFEDHSIHCICRCK